MAERFSEPAIGKILVLRFDLLIDEGVRWFWWAIPTVEVALYEALSVDVVVRLNGAAFL